MADFSIALTVPDNRVTELVAAMNWAWGYDGSPGNELKTAAQLKAEYKTRSVAALKDIFTRHQQYLRDQQALAAAPDIT